MTMNEDERIKHLIALGINPDGKALAALPVTESAQPPTHTSTSQDMPVLAPPGTDPRLQPVDEIVFDPRLLDRFQSLDKDLRAASDYVFSLYKSYGKDTPRHSMLHRKITSFITEVRRSRTTGGYVSETIKTTKEQRDLAQVVAANDSTAVEVAQALRLRQALLDAGVDIETVLEVPVPKMKENA